MTTKTDTEMNEYYATKRIAYIVDTFAVIALVSLGITYNLFRWDDYWWYCMLTLFVVIGWGHIMRWKA